MYDIGREPLKSFITNRDIKLPRFQRKLTWDEKKNFQLCISVFKEYPMGVYIVQVINENGKTVRSLLDGRQRKNALTQMFEDPEIIYHWARKFIGFSNSAQPDEIKRLFREKIDEYLEADSDEELESLSEVVDDSDADGDELAVADADGDELSGIDLLLHIIKITHNKNKKGTGFTRPFDFYGIVDRLPYIKMVDGGYQLSCRKLKTFIDEYRNYCNNNELSYNSEKSFVSYVCDRGQVGDAAKRKLEQVTHQNWIEIEERINIVDKIESLLSRNTIGVIEVKNVASSDAQKIFNIINSKGEKLTAVEILSANSYWNKPLHNPSESVIQKVKDLYKEMEIIPNGIVRWDIPATLLSRLGSNIIFKDLTFSSKSDFAKKLTLGFKLLAGILEKGVKKDDIEKLGKDNSIDWNLQIEEIINNLCLMLKVINDIDYFKYLKSWNTNIMDLTSDAIALNFCIIMYKDWTRKEKPVGNNVRTSKFQKNCIILFDRLIFEYVHQKWRGSSDSIIARNIASFDSESDVFAPVPKEDWNKLLFEEIFEKSSIDRVDVSIQTMKPILYHFYCLKNLRGPDESNIEIDHIIPQSLFTASTIAKKEVIKDNLFNLGLLPKKDNISKSDKELIDIKSEWLKDQVEKYEFVVRADYPKFSNVNNYGELFEMRKAYFEKAFGELRDNIINN